MVAYMILAKAAFTVKKIKHHTAFLRTRLFAILLLSAMTTVSLIAFISMTRTVTINDGDTTKVLMTIRNDVGAVLSQAGIATGEYDKIETDGGKVISKIKVLRAFEVKVTADSKTHTLMLVGGSVSDALREADVVPQSEDTVNFDERDGLCADMHIFVDRIGYKTYEKTEKIAYKTISNDTSTLKKGITKIVTEGKQGERVTVFQDKIVNGEVVETIQVERYISKYSVDEVKMVGTASATPVVQKVSKEVMLDKNGVPLNYKTYYEGRATAYTASAGQSTASGRKPMVGHVAVNPSKIPYGTKLYICSPDGKYVYGYAIAADTGGALQSGKALVDVYYDTTAECRSFGARNMRVYILE